MDVTERDGQPVDLATREALDHCGPASGGSDDDLAEFSAVDELDRPPASASLSALPNGRASTNERGEG